MPKGNGQGTRDALVRVAAALDVACAHDRSGVSPQERLELMDLVRPLARRLAALEATLVGEADAVGASEMLRGTPTTSYLALDGAATKQEAVGAVFAGRDLAESDVVREAALDGELSLRAARVVTKAVKTMPDGLSAAQREAIERELIAEGADIDEKRVDLAVRRALEKVAPELVPGPEDEQERLAAQRKRAMGRRSLRFLADGDGGVDIRGSLPVLEAAPLRAMVAALVESDRRESRAAADRRQREGRTPEQRRADALILLVQRAGGGDLSGSQREAGGESGSPSGAAVRVVSRSPSEAGHGRDEEPPTALQSGNRGALRVAGDRPRIVVTIREGDLRQRAEQAGLLADGSQVGAAELRRLCCDADLMPVVLSSAGVPMDVGRERRLVSPAIRKALTIRDGGCVFPGCGAPDSRCEAHHVVPWYQGGPTSLDNLVLLCPHHHAVIEPDRMFPDPDQGVVNGTGADRWEVRVVDGLPEVIPPARLDAERHPIRRRAG